MPRSFLYLLVLPVLVGLPAAVSADAPFVGPAPQRTGPDQAHEADEVDEADGADAVDDAHQAALMLARAAPGVLRCAGQSGSACGDAGPS